jgi:hypothetical protein
MFQNGPRKSYRNVFGNMLKNVHEKERGTQNAIPKCIFGLSIVGVGGIVVNAVEPPDLDIIELV